MLPVIRRQNAKPTELLGPGSTNADGNSTALDRAGEQRGAHALIELGGQKQAGGERAADDRDNGRYVHTVLGEPDGESGCERAADSQESDFDEASELPGIPPGHRTALRPRSGRKAIHTSVAASAAAAASGVVSIHAAIANTAAGSAGQVMHRNAVKIRQLQEAARIRHSPTRPTSGH
ncbi:hypothetical protein [Streptomyces rimosus]|uniref:hypothetical protein n=1 Tax=Streptomyces rimosus TaxID=1927 RepID=UPI00131D7940|nr:hypothetical protein [Streptomyces rimosus]